MYAFVTLRVPAETPIIMLSDTSKRGYTMIRRCTGALTARLNGMLTTELFSFGELAKMFGTLLLDQFFICFISVLSTAMVASTGEAAMAAASMVGTINALVTLVFLSVATGGAIVIARAKGSGDLHEMRCAIGETVGLSFALGLGVAALLFTLSPLLVDWLYPNVEPLLRSYSIEYMRLMCISFIPFSVFNAIFNAYRAIGDTRSSLALTVIINGLHLVFCLLFINVLKMGITGAGLSYIVVRVVGMAAALYWLLFFHNPCGVRVGHFFRFSRRVSREIVHLGVPIAMESALMQGGMLLVQIYLARLSTMEIAAHAVSNSILNLYYIPGQTLVTLASTVCGQCIGESQPLIMLDDRRKRVDNIIGVVVKQNDVAVFNLVGTALDDVLRSSIFPVQRVDAPLHGLIAFRPGHLDHPVVVVPIRRPEKRGTNPCQFFHFVRHHAQFFPDTFFPQLAHLGMGIGVVADLVTPGENLLHHVRIFVHPASYQKEGRFHPILIQNIQNRDCLIRAP